MLGGVWCVVCGVWCVVCVWCEVRLIICCSCMHTLLGNSKGYNQQIDFLKNCFVEIKQQLILIGHSIMHLFILENLSVL